ncbi:hypothetical protein SAMN05443575_2568 [Jatrophihabitans endophyticus]|uniref:Excreted virulence factor EspC, type VII ESX diderm n=1 Tax=Jatrophihabitans endophyticus TaxID=1206085 RepID=A0A1M5LWU4_9ACTN|nr:hypothetical protein [Jatrophihabitans endophyticus]SHG69528.1 hypothetical protein SAMN05443575_2568 [Jatrophihabitans endophyticus]
MTDYDYGQHRVELGGDTSDNNASGMSGYTLDVRPDPSWPGTSANTSQLRADPDKMNQVADTIDHIVQTLQGNGLPSDVKTTSANAMYGPDTWLAAKFLKQSTSDVADVVGEYMTKLITNLQSASGSIRGATGSLAGSEQANTQSANTQHSQIDTSGM